MDEDKQTGKEYTDTVRGRRYCDKYQVKAGARTLDVWHDAGPVPTHQQSNWLTNEVASSDDTCSNVAS